MKCRVLLSIIFFLWSQFSFAQISSGGHPSLLPEQSGFVLSKFVEKMPPLPKYISKSNVTSPKENAQALRFAHPFFVDYTPQNSGSWSELDDGQEVWHLALKSEGAYSLNIIFDRFHLVEGATLYIFNADQSIVLGAFTSKNNSESGVLATSPIPGETVIVELQEPAGTMKFSEIVIGAVNHDYKNLYATLNIETNRFERSGDCHPEYTCEESAVLLNAGKSVCRIIVDGTTLCTGTLLNNSANDGTPYVLTAAHCLNNSNEFQATIFTFNYQVPNCTSFMEGNFLQSLSGSILRSYAEDLDVTLLEINELPPATYQPVWAGWNRSTSITAPVTAIHQPEGDVKKIARDDQAPIKTSFYTPTFKPDSHWRIDRWESGSTENGSSGAALFDAQGYVIGSLSGGNATCSNPVNDNFSRFEKAWNFYSDSSKQLAAWLDPLGHNPVSLPPLNAYEIGVERWSNFTLADIPVLHKLTGGEGTGYWAGHNSRKDLAVAESYGPFSKGTLYGVWLMPGLSQKTNDQAINVKIWRGGQIPQQQLAVVNNVKLSSLKSNREHLITLDEPIQVSGNIWVEISLNYFASTDTLAFYRSAENVAHLNNTFWLKNASSQWVSGADLTGFSSSVWIDLMMSGAVLADTSISETPIHRFSLSPNPADQFVNIYWEGINGASTISIFNYNGQKLKESVTNFTDGFASLSIEDIPTGIYLIKIVSKDVYKSSKIMIVR